MAYNQNDSKGPVQTGQAVWGTVVSRNDPLKRNRFQVRISGDEDDQGMMPDQTGLQWMQCMTPGSPQMRQNGTFPAGYMVGSKVMLQSVGGQSYVIAGAFNNNESNDSTQDVHNQATDTSLTEVTNAMGPIHPDQRSPKWGEPFGDEGTIVARAYTNLTEQTPQFKGDPVPKIADQAPTPDKYGQRRNSKNNKRKNPLGSFKFPTGDAQKVDKEMEATQSPELIKNALNMIDNLRKTAEGGQNPKMPESVGGMGNIMGALSMLASLFQQQNNQQQQEQQKKTIIEEELRKIYKKFFPDRDPLDLFGKETEHYKAWRAEYLQMMGLEEVATS